MTSEEFSHSWRSWAAKRLIAFTCLEWNLMTPSPSATTTSQSQRSLALPPLHPLLFCIWKHVFIEFGVVTVYYKKQGAVKDSPAG